MIIRLGMYPLVWLLGNPTNPLGEYALSLEEIRPGISVAILDKDGRNEQTFRVMDWPYFEINVERYLYKDPFAASFDPNHPDPSRKWTKKLFWEFAWKAKVIRKGQEMELDLGQLGISRLIIPFWGWNFRKATQYFYGHSYGVRAG